MKRPKLNECFHNWDEGGGIFSALNALHVPWADPTDVNLSAELDYLYHGNNSGDKFISPIVKYYTDKSLNPPIISGLQKTMLARMALRLYGVRWAKEYETMSLEYNPIENYSMTEEMADDETVIEYGKTHTRTDNLSHAKTGTETTAPNTLDTRTDNLSHGKTGTETTTPNTTETRTDNLAHTVNHGVYGFNGGNTSSPADTESGGNTGTQTVAKTGQETLTHNTTDTETGTQTYARTGQEIVTHNTTDTDSGTQTDADTGSDTHTRNYELTRRGNIGVTTSQQMLQSERDLWLWNYFSDVVFPDLDKLLTIPIY